MASAWRSWSSWRRRSLIASTEMPGRLGLGEPLRGHQFVARADQQRVEHLGLGVERAGGADPEVHLVVADDERLRHVAPHPVAEHLDRGLARCPHREHELVAAEAGGDQVGPADLVDAVGDRAEHRVAGRLAVQLVDRAEVDDVDDQDAEPAALRDQLLGMAHEPVAVEQAGAAVVLGEEVHPVAGVGERRGDLGADHVAVHDRIVEQVVHRELAGDLLVGPVVVGHQEAGVEGDRAVRRHRADRVEHVLAIFRMQVVEDRPATDQFGVVAEQSGDRAVDRADQARAVDQHDHAVHVRHHGPQHAGVTLVEVEPVPVGDVAGDDHDRCRRCPSPSVDRMGAAELEVHPGAAPGAHPDRDQLADTLGPDGLAATPAPGRRSAGCTRSMHRRADHVGGDPSRAPRWPSLLA